MSWGTRNYEYKYLAFRGADNNVSIGNHLKKWKTKAESEISINPT